ncbi:MAG TPA: glycoside hydrolase family 16 protein [Bacteroidia bacterium]|jgi:beta-glucanase (GH16 family)|nr:glycoside hydrolase family 16 protein [Bacteroidia bacterium]
MRKIFNILALCVTFNIGAQVMWQFNKDTVITWHYTEGDEFNDKNLNTDYWEYWYGWARTIYSQKEQQYYTDGQNHELHGGLLVLNAKKKPVFEKLVDWMGDNDSIFDDKTFMGLNKRQFNYTAGMIQSKKEILYGYFEIKFTMSPTKGYWPAFWLWGGTPNEEIDICELKTEKKNKIHVGRHSQKEEENNLPYFLFKKKLWGDWVTFNGNLTQGYNVIAGEWDKDYIKYYLNGECIAYTKVSLNVPKRLVANIAVPAKNGPFKPGPSEKDSGAADFKIDYIRVWSLQANEKNDNRQKKVLDNFLAKRELGRSSLRSKSKFLYGKKVIHKNEGITVSLVPSINHTYELTVLGKYVPADAVYTLYSNEGKKLVSVNLNYGESVLNLEGFNSKEFQLVIEAFGKKVTYHISTSGN